MKKPEFEAKKAEILEKLKEGINQGLGSVKACEFAGISYYNEYQRFNQEELASIGIVKTIFKQRDKKPSVLPFPQLEVPPEKRLAELHKN